MPAICVERTIGKTKRAVLAGQRFRGTGHGAALIEAEARQFGAVRSHVDTMSVQAPGFYRKCGYQAFGTIDGYPDGVTRQWFTEVL